MNVVTELRRDFYDFEPPIRTPPTMASLWRAAAGARHLQQPVLEQADGLLPSLRCFDEPEIDPAAATRYSPTRPALAAAQQLAAK